MIEAQAAYQAESAEMSNRHYEEEENAVKEHWQKRVNIMQGAIDALSNLTSKINGGEASVAGAALDWMGMNTKAYAQFKSGDVFGAVVTTINGIEQLVQRSIISYSFILPTKTASGILN